jgi:hypothetical protein
MGSRNQDPEHTGMITNSTRCIGDQFPCHANRICVVDLDESTALGATNGRLRVAGREFDGMDVRKP